MHTISPDATRARRAIGAMFFSVFGALWLAGWAINSRASPVTGIVIGVLALVLTALAVATYRRHAPALAAAPMTEQGARAKRVFNLVNAGQWLLIAVLAMGLNRLGLAIWVIPMIIIVIGLHFLPLAYVFAYRPHYLTGAAFLLLGVAYPQLAPRGPLDPAGFLGAGLILWTSAMWAIKGTNQRNQ